MFHVFGGLAFDFSTWVKSSLYNDNLIVLAESLAAIGSGTRGFQKAQMGSNES